MSDAAVTTDGFTLTLERESTLVDRTLADLGERAPALRAALPDALFGFRETKWRGTGTLRHGDQSPVPGSALYEVVRMR